MADFGEIYTKYFSDVYKYVLTLCRNEAVAEEVTQETFFKAMQYIDRFNGSCRLYVWLCQIAKNTFSALQGVFMKRVIGLLPGIVLIISIIALTACEGKKPITDTDTSVGKNTEETITGQTEPGPETDTSSNPTDSSSNPWENSDEVLKTMEMPFGNGRVLTLHVIGKKREDIQMYGVREICVYDGENLLQSILIQEAINIDGVNGIDEGYSECPSAEESAALKDINFDGYLDLEVYGWLPNNSIPYYYWCWNNDTQRFEYGFCLQLSEIDEENKQLITWYKEENGLYHTDRYRINDQNKLELVDRKIEDVRPK